MAVMNGTEHFSINGQEMNLAISDFWRWAYSDFTSGIQRSRLSEYIVASALDTDGIKSSRSAFPGKPYDLLIENGSRITVKSAAYIQSQEAEHPDYVSFSISSSMTGEPDRRGSDIYIFCLYKGMKEVESPLNLDLWEFYVLRSSVLDEKKPNQKTITLPSLIRLEPLWCDYHGIGEAIQTVMGV